MSTPTEMAIETPASFTFLPHQLKILQDNLAEVQTKERKKEKHKLIKKVRKEVLELPESKALPLERREDLKVAIDSWFARRTKGRSQKIKFGKTWNGRMVMYEEQKESVNELKVVLYEKARKKGKAPRTPFHYFQKSLSIHWNKLKEQERDGHRAMAEKWNSEGVSPELKRQAASKQAVSYIKKFSEDMYKSMGVRFLFITALESPEGTIETGVLDFNDSIGGGTSYTSVNPNWKTEGIDVDSWNAHCKDYYNPEPGTKVQLKTMPRQHLTFEENEYGEPILPNPLNVPKRKNARIWRQAVIRGFLSKHYALASGSRRKIPWQKFVPRARECIEEEYLPAEHLEDFGEPSTMRDLKCLGLLNFWYARQQAGDSPTFRFQYYLGAEELFPSKPREIKQAVSPNTLEEVEEGIGEGRGMGIEEDAGGRPENGATTEKQKGKAKDQGIAKGKGKGKGGGKGKGKRKVLDSEEESANSSDSRSSSEEPALGEGSSGSEEELDWGHVPESSAWAARKNSEEERSAAAEPPDTKEGLHDNEGESPSQPIMDLQPELAAIQNMFSKDPQNMSRLLVQALSSLQVHSAESTPQKPTLDKKRRRPSSPGPPESPTKKSKELKPEESPNPFPELLDSFPTPSPSLQDTADLATGKTRPPSVRGAPPMQRPNIRGTKGMNPEPANIVPSNTTAPTMASGSHISTGRTFRGVTKGQQKTTSAPKKSSTIESGRVTRSQIKSEQRSLRSKVEK